MGRPLVEARNNKGSAARVYNVGYTYYKNGSPNTLTYPSGDVLTYSIGGTELPLQVKDSNNNFATSATYTPSGLLAGMTNGSGIVTSNIYNDRLQPILLSAGLTGQSPIFSLCYDFHLHVSINSSPCTFNNYFTGDNGNVFQIINNLDSTRSTAFAYDFLNRLSQANTITTTGANCWGETYTIDAWGNLTNRGGVSGMGSCYSEILNAAPASPKNQLNGIFYDAAGNVTNDGNGNQPTYDSENRIATDAGVTYYYDADGFRMEKSPGNMYWPGPGGEVLAETDLSGTINAEYVYFNGERIARIDRPSGAVHYYFSDNLESASVITDASGNVQQRYYYYPYGGMQSGTGNDPNHYKFTGKERDSESGLDNFGARYDASSLGRFMTPDWAAKPTAVPYAHYGNPQSLNLYSYVNNNPTTFGDPDGHEVDLSGTDKEKLAEQQRLAANASKTDKNGVKESSLFKQTTDKNGKTTLTVDKKAAAAYEGKHSAGYNLLAGAIDAKPTITVQMSNFDSYTSPADAKGNVTVNLNRNESKIDIIAPLRGLDGQKISNPFNIIAGHEVLGHAYPRIMGWDSGEKNAREVENELRQEQGLPLRDPNSN
jgi:RHS repeat-associated protein